MYMPSRHEYIKVPASAGPAGLMGALGGKLPDFGSLDQSPKTLREETIEIGNQKHNCWVVENKIGDLSMPMPMPMPGSDANQIKIKDFQTITWIDKRLLIDVRQDASTTMDVPGMPSMTTRTVAV